MEKIENIIENCVCEEHLRLSVNSLTENSEELGIHS